MFMKKRLFIDIDGTLAQFHDADKMFIEAMWTQGFYISLKPFDNIVAAVKLFIKENPNVEVYVLSAVLDTIPPFVVGEKNEWLDTYLPEVPKERRIFTRAGENKADYIGEIGPGDYLLDDYNKNLHEFEAAGGHSIKFRNDVNHKGLGAYGGEAGRLWGGSIISYNDTPQALAYDLSLCVNLGKEVHSLGPSINASLNDRIAEAKGGVSRDSEKDGYSIDKEKDKNTGR